MKYVAFRVVRSYYDSNSFLVQGQKITDYNWSTLREVKDEATACRLACYQALDASKKDPGRMFTAFRPDGYGVCYFRGTVYTK